MLEKNRLLQRDVDRIVQQLKESGVPESKDDMKAFVATFKGVCDDQREVRTFTSFNVDVLLISFGRAVVARVPSRNATATRGKGQRGPEATFR